MREYSLNIFSLRKKGKPSVSCNNSYLDNHLEEVLHPERGGQPPRVRRDVHHGLEDPDGLVQHRFRVGVVVGHWQLGAGEVGLQEEVGLGVRGVHGVRVLRKGKIGG